LRLRRVQSKRDAKHRYRHRKNRRAVMIRLVSRATHAWPRAKWTEPTYFPIPEGSERNGRQRARLPPVLFTVYPSWCRLALGDDRRGRFALTDEASPQTQGHDHQRYGESQIFHRSLLPRSHGSTQTGHL